MKLGVLFIFLVCPFLGFSQDTLTVVAVGEAEVEKDLISFVKPQTNLLTANEVEDMDKILEIMQSDFDFYRNLFKVDKTLHTDIKKASGRYIVTFSISKNEKVLELNFVVKDGKLKQDLLTDKVELKFSNVRAFAHDISHSIYRIITGKKSIFKSKILFVSDKGSTSNKLIKDLYQMDFDGANKQRLTFLKGMIISPALSQDNQKVLYSVIEASLKKASSGERMQKVKNINLYLLNLKTRKSKLISNVDGINSGAIFNKTGDSIYLTLSYLKNADIYKMNLNTGQKRRVTNHFSDDVDPHINADESMLTFLSGRPGKAMIYIMDPRGIERNVKRIGWVGDFNAAPRFNPEGNEIAFSSWVDNRFDIYRIGSDGKNLHRLTKNFGSNEEPWFSPDGEFIVFTSQRVITQKKAVQDVYIMNREGEIIRKITENYGKIYTPRWSN